MPTKQIISQSSQALDSDDEFTMKNNLNKVKFLSPMDSESHTHSHYATDDCCDEHDPNPIQKQNTFTLNSMLSRKIVKMPTTIKGEVMDAIAENSEKTSFVTDSDADIITPNQTPNRKNTIMSQSQLNS